VSIEETTEQSFAAAEARKALIAEMGKSAGFADPKGVHNGGQMVLKDIHPLRALFQPRQEFEGHISELKAALKLHGALDPILVGWTGKRVILIEGHHRYVAYERSGFKLKPVDVQWFVGPLNAAVEASIAANSKMKLPMTLQEKLNAAWRLVRLGGFSKAQIVRSSGISDGQVGKMRRVLASHQADVVQVDEWAKAWKIATKRGEERTEEEHEEYLNMLVEQYQQKIHDAVGTKLASNPEMMARVMARHCGRNFGQVFQSAKQLGLIEVDEFDPEADF
jgi:ParB-like chromosome segregation protein Spo0J